MLNGNRNFEEKDGKKAAIRVSEQLGTLNKLATAMRNECFSPQILKLYTVVINNET